MGVNYEERRKREEAELQQFLAWVDKWKIGRGMNDKRGTKRYSGFDGYVGPGWLPILDRLADDLVKMGWDRELHQVKEKFGTLRFYIGHGTDAMFARIDQAEQESARTCEGCGAPGTARGGGWVKTLCDACDEKTK